MLDLSEVRDAVLARSLPQREIWKFIAELGWRDYWRRVYAVLGDGVWQDIDSPKTGAGEYADALPEDILRRARPGSRASTASPAICSRRGTCTIMRACTSHRTSCITGVSAGKRVRAGI